VLKKPAVSRVLGAIVFIVALATFAGTLGHDFVWDDQHLVHYSRQVVARSGPAGLWAVPFLADPDEPADTSGYYRPLSFFSMWVNDLGEEPEPFTYHLLNILLHAVNSVLVFFLIRLVIQSEPAAFMAGLLFAVHPVHAESVAFISGRTDLLAALFTLTAFLCWYRSRRPDGRRALVFLAAGLTSFLAACLSKEIAYVLPFVVVLWALADPVKQTGEGRFLLSRDMAWFLGMVAVAGLTVAARIMVLGIGFGPGWSSSALTAGSGLLVMVRDSVINTGIYLRLLLLPWPLKVYYPPSPPEVNAAVALSAVVFMGAWIMTSGTRHGRIGCLSMVWTVLFILPVSGVVGLGSSSIAERFCYLPSVGAVLLAGYGLALVWSWTSQRKAVVAAVCAVGLAMFYGSVRHADSWSDEVTLFTSAVSSSPFPVPNMYFNLGNAYVEAGRPHDGIRMFTKALSLRPSYADAMLNMASTYIILGEHESALRVLSEASILDQGDARIWSNMGVVYDLLGRDEEALEAYRKSVDLDPGNLDPRFHMGNLLYRMGRFEESGEAYRAVLAVDGSELKAMLGLGLAFEGRGMLSKAGEIYMEAMEEHPGEIVAYLELGRVFLQQNKPRQAGAVYRMALKLDPADPGANKGLVVAALGMNDPEGASRHIEMLAGKHPELSRELAGIYREFTGTDGMP
jgi:tetratricopeptide (TPR) repeat protein